MTQDAPDRATREPSNGGKRLVLVVQGIGDEAPGATVGSLARSMATATGRSRVPTKEVLWLAEGSGRQIDEEDFQCHIERLRGDGAETVLAEVYWADLSRPGHKVLDLLLAVPRVLFGLHQAAARHAADPARKQGSAREPAAEVLHKLSLVIAHIVRGPVAAAALHFALLSAITLAAAVTVGTDLVGERQAVWVAGIFLATNLAACLVGAWGFRRRRGDLFRALFLWLTLFGVTGVVTGLATSVWFSSLAEEARLGESWLFSAWVKDTPQALAFFLIALATLPWLVARIRAEPARRPGIDLAQALNTAVLGLWVLFVWSLYLVSFSHLPEAAGEAQELATGTASAVAFYGSLGLLPIGALLVTLVRSKRWVGRNRAASYEASRPVPRLALTRGAVVSLIALPVLLLGMSYVPGFWAWLGAALGDAERFVIPAVALLSVVVGYGSENMRTVLDFALDIVHYLEADRSREDGELVFARRQRIRNRFGLVLDALVRREQPDHVTVLAHSLGTIIAIEALADDGAEALRKRVARTDLVTMASPFHHLLQHYLPNEYPPLSDERWDGLRRRIDRWVNIFRIDDPVGTDIEPRSDWPENCPVDPGGHTNYWSDRQVLQILDDRQLV